MCSPVYCLTPPSLLSRYCFSRFTCVLLVCLPIYSPGVSSPVLICCFSSCECYVCTYCSYLPVGLFFPLGVVFVHFCFILLLKTHHSPALESLPHLSSTLMTEQISQMRTQRRMGSHQPPASNISSPLYQRILQFQALSSIRQQGTDVRRFALTFCGAAEGWGYNDAALKASSTVPLRSPSAYGG